MSQAPVGQRSAHRLQCRHTSSSLTITRSVFSGSDTYRSCSRFSDGAVSRVRRSASSPLVVKVMQSVGQMSPQESHSMHLSLVNTVCTDRKRVVSGKSVSSRVDHGGRRVIKKKTKIQT